MQNKIQRHANIGNALELDSDPASIITYYAKWAETYDKDVIDGYVGIKLISELMHRYIQSDDWQFAKNPAALTIVDVGCGTGIGGSSLAELGYTGIDGIDLSPEMIVKARESGFYTNLYDGININQPLEASFDGVYDATVCLGTFTPGHVLPEALNQLFQMTRSNGVVLVSTRPEYYDTTDFQQVSDRAEANGLAVLKQSHKDAPYRDDGNAHYWVYQVTR